MIINQVLEWGFRQLKEVGVESPVLDAELLLAHAMRKERVWLFAHSKTQLTNLQLTPANEAQNGRAALGHFRRVPLAQDSLTTYKLYIQRRVQREPVAYILGHKEFYGLDFLVNRDVLIPRPESELLVLQAIRGIMNQESGSTGTVLVDVGTGSGAIVVALANELGIMNYESGIQFFAIDNSLAALRVARNNARRHGVAKRIKFLQGNLLQPIISNLANLQFSKLIIIANLPYLSTSEWRATAPEIKKYEPRGALDGGRDGLRYYRKMFSRLSVFIRKYPCLPRIPRYCGVVRGLSVLCLCEICPHQAGAFKKVVRKYFPKAKISVIKDLAGKDRVVSVVCDK